MGMQSGYHIIGVDGGGTGCRATVCTADGRHLASASGGPANAYTDLSGTIENVLTAVRQAAAMADVDVARSVAHLGLAGVMSSTDSNAIASAMPFACVAVTDDRATSVFGALGDVDGVLAAIGTGTIVAAQAHSSVRYFGGWGSQLADQASGGWLGHQALRRAVLASDGLAPSSEMTQQLLARFGGVSIDLLDFVKTAKPGDYAELAPIVLDAATAKDSHALALMQEGVDYLMSCFHAAGAAPGTRLCLAGGIGPHYAPYLDPVVQSGIQPPKGTALEGAVELAKKLLEAKAITP